MEDSLGGLFGGHNGHQGVVNLAAAESGDLDDLNEPKKAVGGQLSRGHWRVPSIARKTSSSVKGGVPAGGW